MIFCVHIFRVVIIFIMIKIFFYICWYRSRQRQLAAYLSNPRNAQIVIVGGRAYLHQMCERQNVSILRFSPEITGFSGFYSSVRSKSHSLNVNITVGTILFYFSDTKTTFCFLFLKLRFCWECFVVKWRFKNISLRALSAGRNRRKSVVYK